MTASIIKEINGRKYIERNGTPYLFYGIQLRIDDALKSGHSDSIAEEYFKKSSENNFKTVMILIAWRNIEQYFYSGECKEIKNMILLAEKYDILLQWGWFGSNVCGAQKSVPQDIWNDKKKYPTYIYKNENVLDCTAENFKKREDKAFNFFLEMLEKYDRNCRTVAIQIENEPDFADWRNQRKERIETINRLGLAVKNGPYKAVTRVNITAPGKYLSTDNLIEELLACDGIDMVGVDVYYNKVSYYEDFIEKMSEFPKNIPHFAEMGAHIDNLPLIICKSLCKGAGCLLYELRTTFERDYDFGLYRFSQSKWIERDGTQLVQHQWTKGDNVPEANTKQIRDLNNTLNILTAPLTLTAVSNMSLHNNDIINYKNLKVELLLSENGVNDFFMSIMAQDGYLYIFTPASGAEFTVYGEAIVEFNSGNGWSSMQKNSNNKYVAQNGIAYRIFVIE